MERNDKIEAAVINAIQLILAEKRTALASLRTGITVFALPLTVLSVLIATSRYYDVVHVKALLIPLLILNAGLVILGSYLVIRAVIRIHRYDSHIKKIKLKHSAIGKFID